MSKPTCEVHKLGLVDYQQAWDLQNHYAAEIAAGKRAPTLLLLEHPHTYTFGKRGDAANLLWDAQELEQYGVSVHWVDRGGDVTYHGPGQLVGYPLLPLGRPAISEATTIPKADYVGFIRKLETVIITAVTEFGILAKQVEGLTGVWVDMEPFPRSKLAAIGVKVDAHGITRHGFAINANPEMHYWDGIVGCGLEFPEISLAQLLDPVPEMETVMEVVTRAFSQVFDHEIDDLFYKHNLSFSDQ